MSNGSQELELRRCEPGDEPAVLALLQASLGWVPDDQHARFFRWKHVENAFGPSPAWVAVDEGRVVGFRVLMRWEFASDRADGRVVRAVRAVDTATHPDYQGRGIFSRLTLHALDELRHEGVAFVFNTPNDQSRPGYLKMGWQLVGRLPVLARPRSPAALARLARARTPADKWSEPSDAGSPVGQVLADPAPVEALLTELPTGGIATRRSVEYLRWRYGFGPLAYRAVVAPGGVADGVVIFRLRRRGPALEAAVCEELAPPATVGRLLRAVLRASGADHAVRLGGPDRVRAGFVPLPGQGPTLVWRDVTGTAAAARPEPAQWRLALGDVELF
ncbi:MAG: GNAT family N-acetyltransferase [Acidimicrobiales bacterium]